jgi:hypothetical protein
LSFSRSISSGTSVRWPAASDETPTTSTPIALAFSADFLRRLEHVGQIDLEAHVGKGRGDDLGAAVVAVLAHLGDEDMRLAAHRLGDLGDAAWIASYSGSPL